MVALRRAQAMLGAPRLKKVWGGPWLWCCLCKHAEASSIQLLYDWRAHCSMQCWIVKSPKCVCLRARGRWVGARLTQTLAARLQHPFNNIDERLTCALPQSAVSLCRPNAD
jgi:hypothetical protein